MLLFSRLRAFGFVRPVSALAMLALLAAGSQTASARTKGHAKHSRLRAKTYMLADISLPGIGFVSDEVPEDGQGYELKLIRQTGESLDVVYRVGDTYIPAAIDSLSQFLRDNHNEEVKSYDPRVFDVLHTLLRKVNRSAAAIEVLCGYRTKETNDALRASHTTNAAEHSQHIEAAAVDIRVPGVPAAELRDAALQLGAGGVGYYPKGQFVHVDTGDVRKWTFARRKGGHARRHRRRA